MIIAWSAECDIRPDRFSQARNLLRLVRDGENAMRKQIIWSIVAGLLLLHVSVMTVLFSWRNPVLELLELWVGLIGLICFLYGFAAASRMEIRLGRFQYQGRKAVLIGLAIAASGLVFFNLVCLLLELLPMPTTGG